MQYHTAATNGMRDGTMCYTLPTVLTHAPGHGPTDDAGTVVPYTTVQVTGVHKAQGIYTITPLHPDDAQYLACGAATAHTLLPLIMVDVAAIKHVADAATPGTPEYVALDNLLATHILDTAGT